MARRSRAAIASHRAGQAGAGPRLEIRLGSSFKSSNSDVQHGEVLDDTEPSAVYPTPYSNFTTSRQIQLRLAQWPWLSRNVKESISQIGHQRPNYAGCSVEEFSEASTTASACIRPINGSPLTYPTSSVRLDVAPIAQYLLNQFCCNAVLVVKHQRSEKKCKIVIMLLNKPKSLGLVSIGAFAARVIHTSWLLRPIFHLSRSAVFRVICPSSTLFMDTCNPFSLPAILPSVTTPPIRSVPMSGDLLRIHI